MKCKCKKDRLHTRYAPPPQSCSSKCLTGASDLLLALSLLGWQSHSCARMACAAVQSSLTGMDSHGFCLNFRDFRVDFTKQIVKQGPSGDAGLL